ncbi:glutamyl-tRNA reductase [Vibrio stylophorae]|nr:glutamyl-tRNA reductase [Vibrio stylophorae]
MILLAIGINHQTAPLALREQVAFGPEKLTQALTQLKDHPDVDGVVIVSTCNRTELYCAMRQAGAAVMLDWLSQFHQVSLEQLMPSVYIHEEQAAVKHLMRVSCGLDSMVLGEPQILGQVKKAYQDAKLGGCLGSTLERVFQRTFAIAKKVRTETDIGGNAVSVAYAACSLARQIFESLEQATVMLVGAGETIALVAQHLHEHGCRQLIVANRNLDNAQIFAEQYQAQVIGLPEISEQIARADIVISSTASPLPIVGKGMVERALKTRRQRPMLLVDIAVPRDIEPEVGELNDAYLYTLDELDAIIAQNQAQRRVEAVKAEVMVTEHSAEFMQQLRALLAVDHIKLYRQQTERMRQELIQQGLQQIANGQDPERVLQTLTSKLTNKLIHAPTVAMQTAAKAGDPDRLRVICESLGLDSQE